MQANNFAYSFPVTTVQKLLKSIKVYQSYWQKFITVVYGSQ